MAQASITEKLNVSKEKLIQTVLNFEAYPQFVEGCKRVAVNRKSESEAQVEYFINMMKEISYTLEHKSDIAEGVLNWKMVSSDFLKKNQGSWKIKETGPRSCEVTYELEIDFNFPVPGFILNRLVKGNLPSMLRNFEAQAKKA